MNYIQRKDSNGLETVDMFEDYKEAAWMVKEYRLSDPSAWYYTSTRPCNEWRRSQLEAKAGGA